jgi:hypothetical protein
MKTTLAAGLALIVGFALGAGTILGLHVANTSHVIGFLARLLGVADLPWPVRMYFGLLIGLVMLYVRHYFYSDFCTEGRYVGSENLTRVDDGCSESCHWGDCGRFVSAPYLGEGAYALPRNEELIYITSAMRHFWWTQHFDRGGRA